MIAQAIHRRRAHVINDLYPSRGPMTANSFFADLLGESAVSDTMTAAGVRVDEDIAFNLSAFWCGVSVISGTLASMPLILYRRLPGGGKERAVDHPVYPIIHDRFCDECDKQSFLETRIAHGLSWGNGYGEIDWNRNGTSVGAVYPIRADRVTPIRIGDANTGEPIIGWDGRTRRAKRDMLAYEISDEHGQKTLFHYQRILHIKNLGYDGIQGYSVVRRAKETIGGGFAGDAHYHKLLGQRAVPAGILTINKPMRAEKKDALKKAWQEQFSGPGGRQGIAVLEGDSKFHTLLMSPQDSQLLESRRFSVEEIARWLVIPVHKLRDVTNSKTRSNIEAENRSFVEDTLRPWARRIEAEINFKLFRADERREYFVEFLFDDLLRGATKDRAESHYKAIQGAWATVNEIRALENLNPIEGGDRLFVPLNMASLDENGEIVLPQGGGSGDTIDTDDADDEVDDATAVEELDRVTRKLLESRSTPASAERPAGPEPLDYTAVDLFRPLLADARSRFVQKEATRLKQGRKRLEKKGEQEYLEWCSAFYDDHAPFIADTVKVVFAAALEYLRRDAGAGLAAENTKFVDRYCRKYASRESLSGKRKCLDPEYVPGKDDDQRAIAESEMREFVEAVAEDDTDGACHE